MNKIELTNVLLGRNSNESINLKVNGVWLSFTRVYRDWIIHSGFDKEFITNISIDLKGDWFEFLNLLADDLKEG